MFRNSFLHMLGLLIAALAATGLVESAEKPITYLEILAARPEPDLTTLVERSSPDDQSAGASESFLDLLKLRETTKAEAVPVLEKVLLENLSSTRIHRFAAAQALFAIGTPAAHQILTQHVLAKEDCAGMAINYTSHWQMQEPLRSRFIEQYLLQNISTDLVIEVKRTTEQPDDGNRINLAITVRNVSDAPFHILNHKTFPGEMLYLRNEAGQYIPRARSGPMCKDQAAYLELKPGQSHTVNVAINVTLREPASDGGKQLRANVISSGHHYDVTDASRFDVIALIECAPLTEQQREYLRVDQDWKSWTGRAVSKPFTVNSAFLRRLKSETK